MTEIQKKPVVLTLIITMLSGVGTSLLVVLAMVLINQEKWYLITNSGIYILAFSIGPLGIGALCLSGYYIAAWYLGLILNRKYTGIIVVIQLLIFALIHIAMAQKAMVKQGQWIPDSEMIRHMHHKVMYRSLWIGITPTVQYQYGDFHLLKKDRVIGTVGYILILVDLLNFVSPAFIGLWAFRKLEYCEEHASYLKKVELCVVYEVNTSAPMLKNQELIEELDSDYDVDDDYHQVGHVIQYYINRGNNQGLVDRLRQYKAIKSPGYDGDNKKTVYLKHCPYCHQGKLNVDTHQLELHDDNELRYRYVYRRTFDLDAKAGSSLYQIILKTQGKKI